MEPNTTTYTAGRICIDELVTVLGQYPDHYWNGWLVPSLDPHAVEQVMAAFAADDHSTEGWPTHEWDGDVLVLTEYDGDTAYPQRLQPDADGLYALGAYSWVWSADTSERAALYMHSATGHAVEQQVRACWDYCAGQGWTVTHTFADKGTDRSQRDALVDCIASGAVDNVVVYSLDRLGRKSNEVLRVVQAAGQHGVDLHTARGPVPATDIAALTILIAGGAL